MFAFLFCDGDSSSIIKFVVGRMANLDVKMVRGMQESHLCEFQIGTLK